LLRHPFCADPFKLHAERVVLAKDLDHIVTIASVWALGAAIAAKWFWDFANNVQGLCHSCHSRKTATEDGGFGRHV
jgi:5-methylcytosine-specific restriction protein A